MEPLKSSVAGVAMCDITPPVGIELVGYHRGSPSDRVLDPLMCTALAFESGDSAAALICIDNVGMLVKHTYQMRQSVAQALGLTPENVMVNFSHTHSGPQTLDGEPLWEAYRHWLNDQVTATATQAWQSRRGCLVGWGVAKASIGVNRRIVGSDGKARMGINNSGATDNRLGVLRIESADNREIIGAAVICTAHGNVLRGDSLAISADYTGWARTALMQQLGCPVATLSGSAGDVNPVYRGERGDLRKMADLISTAVVPVVQTIPTEQISDLWIGSSVLRMDLQPLPSPSEAEKLASEVSLEWGVSPAPWLKAIAERRRQGVERLSMDLEVQLLRVNDGFFAGIPMEPFVEIGLAVSRQMGHETAFFGGYTNGHIGYLSTAEQWSFGGYEVEWMPVVYGPNIGDFLMPACPETAGRAVAEVLRLARRAGCFPGLLANECEQTI